LIVFYYRKEIPKLYPDFMEKFSTKRTCLSKRVLGQLYRHCERFEIAIESETQLNINVEPNIKFYLKGI
jgi:hypothetical protein